MFRSALEKMFNGSKLVLAADDFAPHDFEIKLFDVTFLFFVGFTQFLVHEKELKRPFFVRKIQHQNVISI